MSEPRFYGYVVVNEAGYIRWCANGGAYDTLSQAEKYAHTRVGRNRDCTIHELKIGPAVRKVRT